MEIWHPNFDASVIRDHKKQVHTQLSAHSIRLGTASSTQRSTDTLIQLTHRYTDTTDQHSRWRSKRTCVCFCHHPCSAGSGVGASHAGPGQCRSMPSGDTCYPGDCTLVPALPALSGSAACAAVGRGQRWLGGRNCPCVAWLAGWLSGGPQPALLEGYCPAGACMGNSSVSKCNCTFFWVLTSL